ncbi:MAG: HEAT repeat domain-containing protein [Chlamydiia bacterium]|nr:HEAT repeat domain-containing protein [Chlamydiia bacterium]
MKRVYSHLVIKDGNSALEECEKGLAKYPDSKPLQKVYLKALAASGKGDEAIAFWKRFQPNLEDPQLIETLAWGVLSRFQESSQFIVNVASLMSAYYTDDVRAVKMLLIHLSSSNALLRATAAQLAPRYRDRQLIETLTELLRTERVWFVRLEVIKALGAMEVKAAEEPLANILIHSRTTAEEKGAAVAALVNIYEEIDESKLLQLIHSKRAGLRHLACQIVSHLDLKEMVSQIEPLLSDPMADVKIAALNTFYSLGLAETAPTALSQMIDLAKDPSCSVALTAAWVISRVAPQCALEVIRRTIYSTDDSSRRLAAFVLGRLGNIGKRLVEEVLLITPDPFVRANLALGMVGQGEEDQKLADILYTFLMLRQGKLMLDSSENPLFQVLSPSKICHIPQVPDYPSMVDHLTRLEILGMLTTLRHPEAEEAVKTFLTHETLGVTFAASMTLLEEGGEEAVSILRALLTEKEDNIRVQAALVLAMMGGETEAIEVLQSAYYRVDREMKINILGALGHIGDSVSIPFLLRVLEEPYQILKVVAASALIQCVYH